MRYDNKVDIYSLGIILIELLKNFKTVSEKIKTL
jgi:serine/threonine protein kinase